MTKKWEENKHLIVKQYKDRNMPLREVKLYMEKNYGFKASVRAYRSRFDKWGISKYNCRRRRDSFGSVLEDGLPQCWPEEDDRSAPLTPPLSPEQARYPDPPPTMAHGFYAARQRVFPPSPPPQSASSSRSESSSPMTTSQDYQMIDTPTLAPIAPVGASGPGYNMHPGHYYRYDSYRGQNSPTFAQESTSRHDPFYMMASSNLNIAPQGGYAPWHDPSLQYAKREHC